jgi:hypothetical protein
MPGGAVRAAILPGRATRCRGPACSTVDGQPPAPRSPGRTVAAGVPGWPSPSAHRVGPGQERVDPRFGRAGTHHAGSVGVTAPSATITPTDPDHPAARRAARSWAATARGSRRSTYAGKRRTRSPLTHSSFCRRRSAHHAWTSTCAAPSISTWMPNSGQDASSHRRRPCASRRSTCCVGRGSRCRRHSLTRSSSASECAPPARSPMVARSSRRRRAVGSLASTAESSSASAGSSPGSPTAHRTAVRAERPGACRRTFQQPGEARPFPAGRTDDLWITGLIRKAGGRAGRRRPGRAGNRGRPGRRRRGAGRAGSRPGPSARRGAGRASSGRRR